MSRIELDVISTDRETTYAIVWEWEHRPLKWRPYTAQVTRLLERAHSRKLNKVLLRDADPTLSRYYVDLTQLLQLHNDNSRTVEQLAGDHSQKAYAVQREFYPSTSPAARGVRWEWAVDASVVSDVGAKRTLTTWHPYDMDIQCTIESAYEQYSASTLNYGTSGKSLTLHMLDLSSQGHPECPYIVNFVTMTHSRKVDMKSANDFRLGPPRRVRRVAHEPYPMASLTQAEIAAMRVRKERLFQDRYQALNQRLPPNGVLQSATQSTTHGEHKTSSKRHVKLVRSLMNSILSPLMFASYDRRLFPHTLHGNGKSGKEVKKDGTVNSGTDSEDRHRLIDGERGFAKPWNVARPALGSSSSSFASSTATSYTPLFRRTAASVSREDCKENEDPCVPFLPSRATHDRYSTVLSPCRRRLSTTKSTSHRRRQSVVSDYETASAASASRMWQSEWNLTDLPPPPPPPPHVLPQIQSQHLESTYSTGYADHHERGATVRRRQRQRQNSSAMYMSQSHIGSRYYPASDGDRPPVFNRLGIQTHRYLSSVDYEELDGHEHGDADDNVFYDADDCHEEISPSDSVSVVQRPSNNQHSTKSPTRGQCLTDSLELPATVYGRSYAEGRIFSDPTLDRQHASSDMYANHDSNVLQFPLRTRRPQSCGDDTIIDMTSVVPDENESVVSRRPVPAPRRSAATISSIVDCRMSSSIVPRSLLADKQFSSNHTIQITFHVSLSCLEQTKWQLNTYLPDTAHGRRLLAKFQSAFDLQLVLAVDHNRVILDNRLAHWTRPDIDPWLAMSKEARDDLHRSLGIQTYLDYMEWKLDNLLSNCS